MDFEITRVDCIWYSEIYEPQILKMYLQMSAKQDSDQSVYLHSLGRIFTGCIFDNLGCKVSSWTMKTDQTVQMHRLI